LARKKLTRKEIRQDRIRSVLVEVYEWLAANSKYLFGVLGAIVVVFVASYGWENFQQGRQREIQQRFSEALEMFEAPVGNEKPEQQDPLTIPPKYRFDTEAERNEKALEAFSSLAADYPNTSVGQFSAYYQAILEQRSGQSQQAEATLRTLIQETDELETKNLARNYLAFVLGTQGKTEEAVALLKEILDEPSIDFPRSSILLKMARAYDSMGDHEAALDNYRKLKAEFPSSQESRAVQARIDLLEAELGKQADAEDNSGESGA